MPKVSNHLDAIKHFCTQGWLLETLEGCGGIARMLAQSTSKNGSKRKIFRGKTWQFRGPLWHTAQRVIPVMPALGHLAHRPFFLTVKTTGLRGFAAKFAVFAAGADCGAEQRFFEHGACSFPLGFLFIIPKRGSCFNCVLLGMGAAPWANGQGAHAEYCAHGVRRHARNKYGFFPCGGRLDDGEQPHQHSKHSKAQRQMCDARKCQGNKRNIGVRKRPHLQKHACPHQAKGGHAQRRTICGCTGAGFLARRCHL